MKNYFINVTNAPYNAAGDGITDDSPAIQKAINDASNLARCVIQIPAGNYLLNTGLIVQNVNSIQIVGEGSFVGTTLLFGGTTGDILTFNNCQQCNVSLLGFQYAENNVASQGNAIKLDQNCYVIGVHDVRMDYCYNGIWIRQATETRLSKIQFRSLMGDYGIKFGGGGIDQGCYRAIFDDILANNPYPFSYPNNSLANPTGVGNWSAATQYNQNDIVCANGCIYQCAISGISDSTGSGPSGNGGGLQNPVNIVDGTAKWNFVSKQITWIIQESNGYSLVLSKAALINGYIGYSMQNTSAPGNPPMWIIGNDIECDHSYYANMQLTGGEGAYICNSWLGSCLTGNALNIIPPFIGQVSLINSRISFAATHGILIGAAGNPAMPADILIQNNFIGGNSQRQYDTYHGIVALGTGISILGNKIGLDIANSTPSQHTGVFMMLGSDQYIIKNNNLIGNITRPLETNNSGDTDFIVGDNLPTS